MEKSALRTRLRLVGVFLPVLLLLFASPANTQTDSFYNDVRRSVVFLYAADPSGQVNTSSPLATGFLVGIPLKTQPADLGAGSVRVAELLVTARHVVDPVWASCPPHRNPSRIFIRFNKIRFDPDSDESGVEYVPVDLARDGPQRTVFTSPDLSVDAAVIVPPATEGKYDSNTIITDAFATSEETKGLDSGVEVFSAGLLPAFPGIRRNYPIFKFGHISAKPDEKTLVPCAFLEPPMSLRMWFIAANLVPGNSGSPVLSLPAMLSGGRVMLIGLQSFSYEGSDVAGITPAHYRYEILESMRKPDWDLREGSTKKCF